MEKGEYSYQLRQSSKEWQGIYGEILIEWYDRDYEASKKLIEDLRSSGDIDNQFVYVPISLLTARIEQTIGKPADANRLFDDARRVLEKLVAEHPEDERFHSALGIAYAGLGRKSDAIYYAVRGADLLPVEKEAWRGSYRLIELAVVYTMVGEHEQALDLLERLVSIPAEFSPQLLKIDPTWDPLRDHPRYQAIAKDNELR